MKIDKDSLIHFLHKNGFKHIDDRGDRLIIYIGDMVALPQTIEIKKLHIGCGDIHLDGYTNVDFHLSPAVDLMLDLSKPLPDFLQRDSVEEILGYHLFEHLPFNGIEQVVNSWYKVLKPGGKLILEMPDFDETVKRYIAAPNDITVIASVFGCQEHEGQFHKWGWNQTRLKFLFQGAGFKDVTFLPATDYHAKLEPSLRVECTK